MSTHESPIRTIQAPGSQRSSVARAPIAASSSTRAILDLQRRAGNRATAAMLSRYYLSTNGEISWKKGKPPAETLRTDDWHETKEHGGDWVYAPFSGVVIKHRYDIEFISTPSDLLTGLMSHPAPSELTLKGYADDGTLRAVLLELEEMSTSRKDRPLTWPRVWQAVRTVCERRAGRVHREFPADVAEREHWRTWKNLQGHEFHVFSDHRRKLSNRDRVRASTFLQERLASHTFVGIHATTVENVGALLHEASQRPGSTVRTTWPRAGVFTSYPRRASTYLTASSDQRPRGGRRW